MKTIKFPKSEIRAMKQFLSRTQQFELVWCDLVPFPYKKTKTAIWWGWMSPDLVNQINAKLNGFLLLPTGECKVVMK